MRFLFSLCLLHWASAASILRREATKAPSGGFYLPSSNGGSMLTVVDGTYPAGLGEPINVIVIGDARLLDGQVEEAWHASLGFSGECLGQWPANQQRANLGDGNGERNQSSIRRWNYGDYNFGSCKETVQGGNHYRIWHQTGSEGNSGAMFLAASIEDDLSAGHDIGTPDGYDAGRDQLVGNATRAGGTSAFGYTFTATASTVTGLLPTGSRGINHGLSIDGNVTVLTVSVIASGQAFNLYSGAPALTAPMTLVSSFLAMLIAASLYLLR